ncbi:ATP-binding protein [Haloarcula onubensis]|uniref:AAA family ATPase n=1 Tax=Haloarcula onubensis TaxID=2950539 RepID=A0ABU2FUM1_9EURY|nr:AAA family ATPase [Halomicroarcula sp. S3CR25-11]MDS0284460.1 AAA family ATPase [Halomicroarcula sp. S3CR25-11]
MSLDAGDALVESLHEHNPWWDDGADAFDLPARQKSDFYHLARPKSSGSQFEDQSILALVGRRGVGKTTLLHQFVHHRIEAGAAPEQFLYLPFDADPLYQLQSDAQLARAVRYYESRVYGRTLDDGPQFVLIDDIHQIEHASKPTIDGWGAPVTELIEQPSDRHVVMTASAEVQIDRELAATELSADAYDVQPILPEKFRDYLFTLYPDLEAEDTRVSPSSIRAGENSLPTAIAEGDTSGLVTELQRKYEKVTAAERRIQSQVVEYLTMGGIISYEHDGAIESASDLTPEDYTHLRENVSAALYQDVPGFESIQTIADLERLCALAARNRATESFRYQELVELFDVDRRTIADSYLPALSELYVLTGVTEYDNSRPRGVRLYLRDTGLVTALADGDASSVRNDFQREAELARVAAFDHTMRFAYGVNAAQGNDPTPSVQYWRGRDGEVDFVFEIGDTPVPIGLAYRSRDRDTALAAIKQFQAEYDAPVGFLLAGDTVRGSEPILQVDDGVIQLPYWLYLLLC